MLELDRVFAAGTRALPGAAVPGYLGQLEERPNERKRSRVLMRRAFAATDVVLGEGWADLVADDHPTAAGLMVAALQAG